MENLEKCDHVNGWGGADGSDLHNMKPPYQPQLSTDDDTRYFDEDIPDEVRPHSTYSLYYSTHPPTIPSLFTSSCSSSSSSGMSDAGRGPAQEKEMRMTQYWGV